MTFLETRVAGTQANIDKKIKNIARLKALIIKKTAKLEKETDAHEIHWTGFEISNHEEDIRRAEKDLIALYANLESYTLKLQAEQSIMLVPAIEEFLADWKVKATEYYAKNHDRYQAWLSEVSTRQEAFTAWKNSYMVDPNGEVIRSTPTDFEVIGDKRIEMRADYRSIDMEEKAKFDGLTIKLGRERDWQAMLEKEMEREVKTKRIMLLDRIQDITGTITDAKGLHISTKGEINGIVIGESGSAKVDTYSAGGWNIQCYHYRVTVTRIK